MPTTAKLKNRIIGCVSLSFVYYLHVCTYECIVHCNRYRYIYGPFANYLQVACHKAKIKEETHAGHQNQVFLMFFDKLQIILMVLVHLHCVQSREIRICMLILVLPLLNLKHIAQGKCTILKTVKNLSFSM